MKCLLLSWGPESGQFSHKIILFVYKPFDIVFRSTFVYLQPLFVTHGFIVEGPILI